MEALRQALSDGKMKSSYRVISSEIEDIFHRPTLEDLAEDQAKEEYAILRKSHTRIGFKGYIGIFIFAAFAIFPIWYVIQKYALQINGHYSKVFAIDYTVYFVIAAIAARIVLGIYKTVKFWIWEAKQDS